MRRILIVALDLTFLYLMLLARIAAATLITIRYVMDSRLTRRSRIARISDLVRLCIRTFLLAESRRILIRFLTRDLRLLRTFLGAFLNAARACVLPGSIARLLISEVCETLTLSARRTISFLLGAYLYLYRL